MVAPTGRLRLWTGSPPGTIKLLWCITSKILDRLGEADIVLPYLTNRKLRPLGRRIGSWGFTTLVNLLFGLRVRYYQGMLPRREMLSKIRIATDSYAFPAEAVV